MAGPRPDYSNAKILLIRATSGLVECETVFWHCVDERYRSGRNPIPWDRADLRLAWDALQQDAKERGSSPLAGELWKLDDRMRLASSANLAAAIQDATLESDPEGRRHPKLALIVGSRSEVDALQSTPSISLAELSVGIHAFNAREQQSAQDQVSEGASLEPESLPIRQSKAPTTPAKSPTPAWQDYGKLRELTKKEQEKRARLEDKDDPNVLRVPNMSADIARSWLITSAKELTQTQRTALLDVSDIAVDDSPACMELTKATATALDAANQVDKDNFMKMLRFFLLPTDIEELWSTRFMFNVKGLKRELSGHQIFLVWHCLFSRVQGLKGKFISDAMGLGKTVEQIALVVVSRRYTRMQLDFWLWLLDKNAPGRDPNLHLDPEDKDSKGKSCPSQGKYPYQCPCVVATEEGQKDIDYDHISYGAAVFICPRDLIENFINEWEKTVHKSCGMSLKRAHGEPKTNDLYSTDSIKPQLKTNWKTATLKQDEWTDACDIALLTRLVEDESDRYAFVTTVQSAQSKLLDAKFASNMVVGQVAIDEWHQHHLEGSALWPLARKMKTRDKKHHEELQPSVLFVSGTPMPKGAESLKLPLEIMMIDGSEPPKQLRKKDLNQLVNLYEKAFKGQLSKDKLDDYHRRLSNVLQLVCIARNAKTIWHDGNFAVDVPLHKHFKIECEILPQYSEVITRLVKSQEKRQRTRIEEAMNRLRSSRTWKLAANDGRLRLKETDVITSETKLVLAQLAFPHLAVELQKPEWKEFTGTQKQLRDKKWYKMWPRTSDEDPFYGDIDVVASPMSGDFDALVKSSTKMRALFALIDKDAKNSKFVVGSSNLLINAITAEALRKKYGCNSVEVLNADNPHRSGIRSGGEKNAAVTAFQERPSPESRFIVVDTTKGAVGYTLDSAFRLVFLVPEFSEIRDQQFASRCYRISQKEPVCYTYRLIIKSKESNVELFLDMDQQSRQEINTGIWSGVMGKEEAKEPLEDDDSV